MSNNFELHNRGMDYVNELLTSDNWNVQLRNYGKDDYFEITKKSQDKHHIIKVKALSKADPVPFSTRSPDSFKADFFIICRNFELEQPEIFLAHIDEIRDSIHEQNGEYWLEPKEYEKFDRNLTRLD